MFRAIPIFTALIIEAAATLPAAAAQRSFRADYSVTFLGMPVAKASFDSTFTDRRFSIEGTLASSGIVRLFDKVDGTTSVAGTLHRGAVRPQSFRADYTSDGKPGRIAIRYAGGTVTSSVAKPPSRRDETWVPVTAKHLVAALDPISATLIRAADPADVCNRTIRAYDGEMRADLQLSHKRTGKVAGFEGEAVTCDARFVPVAGYRGSRSQIAFLRDKSRIVISFVRLGDTGVFTPVEASVGTQIGTVRIAATRIEAR